LLIKQQLHYNIIHTHTKQTKKNHTTRMTSSKDNSCRMYEKKYPEVDELVMVNVKSIAEMGAYVSLLEYNNIEGMILLSELSRRRIRSISKLIRVGRQEVVVVLRVDKEKGYIDLSKRRVSVEEVQKCEERYNKSKAVHSIMRHVAETCEKNLEGLYLEFGWPLYKRFSHAYEAFKLAVTDPDEALRDLAIDPVIREALIKNIRRRLTPQPIKIRADIEVTCFQYEGIDAIKTALKAGELVLKASVKVSDPSVPQDVLNPKDNAIKLVAPPLYVMVGVYLDKDYGISQLNHAIEVVKEELVKGKGELVVKVAPRAVNERDDQELLDILSRLESSNQEVSGDDDISDEEEEEGGSKAKTKSS